MEYPKFGPPPVPEKQARIKFQFVDEFLTLIFHFPPGIFENEFDPEEKKNPREEVFLLIYYSN